ncbi:hypothetical protein [Sulfobacillus thermosulfidooxidans]|uniref:hypothetical protein n=1 Tax=Sulfobacillus thermosulfidooxidans TaxID=28034 RepID=UPI00096B9878|nr:hypothetical protein [Sulfobacillus thermosulfidooxidans]OLZ11950.1 hypothetical protein BFX05_05595 [Sulfobacillus thermosulfidooxidans]OLZ17633.1 hypothetical protein BFX06_12840 [Sulfobacillus thermosulfidooxidans]OLZ22414.1 hypothetical protein BFX07_00210 [Sulfobacillus thermosulfidooxidans]
MNNPAGTKESILIISDFPQKVSSSLVSSLGLEDSSPDHEEITVLNLGGKERLAVPDVFYDGYIQVLTDARKHVGQWIDTIDSSLLIGLGLGGLVALWACADNRQAPVRGIVAIGSTPHLEFLKDRHPYYDWPADTVKKTLLDWDVSYKVPRIGSRHVLLLHGDHDQVIGANWIEEFFLLATGVSRFPDHWEYHRIRGLGHDWDHEGQAVQEARQYLHAFHKKIATLVG